MHARAPVAWAHRDVKPENVLLADGGRRPVLTDFGSAAPAVVPIPDRRAALALADAAATHCTLPYRAPELWALEPRYLY